MKGFIAFGLLGMIGIVQASALTPIPAAAITKTSAVLMKGQLGGNDIKATTDRLFNQMNQECEGQGYTLTRFWAEANETPSLENSSPRYIVRGELTCDMTIY